MLNIEMELKKCKWYSELTDEMKSYLIDKAVEHGTQSIYANRGITEMKVEARYKLDALLREYSIDIEDDEWKELITRTFEAVINYKN